MAAEAGVTNDRFTKAVVWGDYDNDRLPDLYVSNLGGPNRLFHNNGDGTFTDLAAEAGVTRPRASFPSWFWDVDNDGALDLFVAAYTADISSIAASFLGRPVRVELARLYRGDGRGGFTDIAVKAGVAGPHSPMGSNFGDLDGDGFLDFYLGTGDPDYCNLMTNLMFLNQSGDHFADVTSAGGFGQLQKGHAVVFADFDEDGDLDLFQQLGGAVPGDAFFDAFYENPGFGNHWLSVELVGIRSNRSAIGARLFLQVTDDGRRRSIYRWVNSGGSFGANPLRQTVGLGHSRRIDRLEVFWPTSGATQVFQNLPADRHVRILEGEDRVVELPRPPFALAHRP
ncbi:MAG: CRTAC1 family protein [Acidobacteriota bacterium]